MSEEVARVSDLTSDRIREQELVRMDGTVLVRFLVGPGMWMLWEPPPWLDYIVGPCAGRARYLNPVSDWVVFKYFPEGYPGPEGPFPQEEING
jgi:hypothetical protein